MRPPQGLSHALAFCALSRKRLIGLRKMRCVFRFSLEYGVHADEEPRQHERALRHKQGMSGKERRIEYLVEGREEEHMCCCRGDEGKDQPVFEIILLPCPFQQISDDGKRK